MNHSTFKCLNCYKRGHSRQYCTEKVIICNFCLGPHDRKNCSKNSVCFRCGATDHAKNDCRVSSKTNCDRCFKAFHKEENCYYVVMRPDVVDYYDTRDIYCISCDEYGHTNCLAIKSARKNTINDRLYSQDFSKLDIQGFQDKKRNENNESDKKSKDYVNKDSHKKEMPKIANKIVYPKESTSLKTDKEEYKSRNDGWDIDDGIYEKNDNKDSSTQQYNNYNSKSKNMSKKYDKTFDHEDQYYSNDYENDHYDSNGKKTFKNTKDDDYYKGREDYNEHYKDKRIGRSHDNYEADNRDYKDHDYYQDDYDYNRENEIYEQSKLKKKDQSDINKRPNEHNKEITSNSSKQNLDHDKLFRDLGYNTKSNPKKTSSKHVATKNDGRIDRDKKR